MNYFSGVRTTNGTTETVQIKQIDDKYYVVSNGEVWGPKMKKPELADTVFLSSKFKISDVVESTEEAYQAAIDKAVDLLVPVYVSKYQDVITTSTGVEVRGGNLQAHRKEIMTMKTDVDFVISGENKVKALAFAKAKREVKETITANIDRLHTTKKLDSAPTKEKQPYEMSSAEFIIHADKMKYPEKLRADILKAIQNREQLAFFNKLKKETDSLKKAINAALTVPEETVAVETKDDNGKVISTEFVPVDEYEKSLDWSQFKSEIVAESVENDSEPIGKGEISEPIKTTVTINNGKGTKNGNAIAAAKQRSKAKATIATAKAEDEAMRPLVEY